MEPRAALEACGAAHHWARMLTGLGHDVKLIAPEAVRPFVKKGKKNDAADAAALCAAALQPDVKFVPTKSLEQQGILSLHSARSLLVKQQTMLANAMRSLATEFGLTVPKGISKLGELMELVDADPTLRILTMPPGHSEVEASTCSNLPAVVHQPECAAQARRARHAAAVGSRRSSALCAHHGTAL